MEYTYTFIIPHHNSPDLLNRCLDSIPQREDIQIIVVDDNSKADLKPHVSRPNVQIIYIDEEHSKGAGRARNYGLKVAKGKWLLFADCDDYYKNGFLDILDKYKQRENIDVVYFNFEYIDEASLQPVLIKRNLQKTLANYDGSQYAYNLIRYGNLTPWTKMVLRSYSEKYEMQFEEVPIGNDILYSFFAASFSERIIIEPSPVYVYLRQKNGITFKKASFSTLMCKVIHIMQVDYLLNHFVRISLQWYRRSGELVPRGADAWYRL